MSFFRFPFPPTNFSLLLLSMSKKFNAEVIKCGNASFFFFIFIVKQAEHFFCVLRQPIINSEFVLDGGRGRNIENEKNSQFKQRNKPKIKSLDVYAVYE